MLTRMIVHGLMAAMIVAGGAFLYAASAQPPGHGPALQYTHGEEH